MSSSSIIHLTESVEVAIMTWQQVAEAMEIVPLMRYVRPEPIEYGAWVGEGIQRWRMKYRTIIITFPMGRVWIELKGFDSESPFAHPTWYPEKVRVSSSASGGERNFAYDNSTRSMLDAGYPNKSNLFEIIAGKDRHYINR